MSQNPAPDGLAVRIAQDSIRQNYPHATPRFKPLPTALDKQDFRRHLAANPFRFYPATRGFLPLMAEIQPSKNRWVVNRDFRAERRVREHYIKAFKGEML